MNGFFGLPLCIDEFSRDAKLYILSHYHRDHMDGFGPGWNKGPVVCSTVTANLLEGLGGLPRSQMILLDADQTCCLGLNGSMLRITALEANHCPGALIFVLECGGRKVVYTGDFRLDDRLRARRHLLVGADVLYVDGTYASPEYSFPTQEESVAMVLDAVRANMEKEILLALYTIGKNRIVEALYREFGRPVFVTKDKIKAYEAMGCGRYVTANRREAGFVGYSREYFDRYFRWTRERNPSNALVIYPSGVSLNAAPRAGFLYVPYSEHCDWREFQEFVRMVSARKVVRT